MHRFTPYRPRPIRFLELWESAGWTVKVYGISAHGEQPSAELCQAAKQLAQVRLPQPAATDERYGAAILIVNQGADGNYVLIDWWLGENMLQHHVYSAPSGSSEHFHYATPDGLGFCVWELVVYGFERQAWIDTMLAAPQPSLAAYFERQLTTRA
jgi:hypothetical protein